MILTTFGHADSMFGTGPALTTGKHHPDGESLYQPCGFESEDVSERLFEWALENIVPSSHGEEPLKTQQLCHQPAFATHHTPQMVGPSCGLEANPLKRRREEGMSDSFEIPDNALDADGILETAYASATKSVIPGSENNRKVRKRTNYSNMTPAEEMEARKLSKERRANLKSKREKVRRTVINTMFEELQEEFGMKGPNLDQAKVLAQAVSIVRKLKTYHPELHARICIDKATSRSE
mmetsp:Transcript_20414/g.33323  ORF Transcript_20414/g.33323 Transcript_20414/m.33323 type:complete len:237 (-) Transcript_20414:91-801(-)